MTVSEWLVRATEQLTQAGIGTARLDALVLLEDELEQDRSKLLAYPENELSTLQLNKLNKKLDRRARHEPLAYVRGASEFYGRKFKVNKRVLEPRPESETMIDLLKELKLPKNITIADIGTGSGALGITAALELHNHKVDLYDIDSAALGVAKHNVVMHELSLATAKRDLLSRPLRTYEIILANLPYVPRNFRLNQSAAMEPRIAIDGGSDGLDVYRRLFEQVQKLKHKPSTILTEALPPQHQKLAQIASSSGYDLELSRDFIQCFTARAQDQASR